MLTGGTSRDQTSKQSLTKTENKQLPNTQKAKSQHKATASKMPPTIANHEGVQDALAKLQEAMEKQEKDRNMKPKQTKGPINPTQSKNMVGTKQPYNSQERGVAQSSQRNLASADNSSITSSSVYQKESETQPIGKFTFKVNPVAKPADMVKPANFDMFGDDTEDSNISKSPEVKRPPKRRIPFDTYVYQAKKANQERTFRDNKAGETSSGTALPKPAPLSRPFSKQRSESGVFINPQCPGPVPAGPRPTLPHPSTKLIPPPSPSPHVQRKK